MKFTKSLQKERKKSKDKKEKEEQKKLEKLGVHYNNRPSPSRTNTTAATSKYARPPRPGTAQDKYPQKEKSHVKRVNL